MSKRVEFTPGSSSVLPGPPGIYEKNRNILFVPAVSTIEDRLKKETIDPEGFSLNWWSPKAFFQHSSILVSSFYGMKRGDYRDHYGIPRKNFTVVGDSGGFQQLTKKVRLDPEEVLRWQEANVDIGFGLDIPPIDPKTMGPVGDFNFFKRCAEISWKNFTEMSDARTKQDFKFYSIIQGGSRKELEYWNSGIKGSFDGVCMSPKPPNDPMQVALHIAFAKSIGYKNIHILLGSGKSVTPIIVYGRRFFDLITFDSSSYAVGSIYKRYNLPTMKGALDFGRKGDKIKEFPCECPICRNCKVVHVTTGGSTPGVLLSLHNLYIYLKFVEDLRILSEDDVVFTEIVRGNTPEKTWIALEFLKYFEEEDFDKAYNRFFVRKEKTRPKEKEIKRLSFEDAWK